MIYLMRHADAVSDEVDPRRPLSARGRAQVARVCAALKPEPAFRPAEVWHSPLARSLETAQLVVAGLGLGAPLVLKRGLQPDDDPARTARAVAGETRDLLLVGHEPHLGILASLLLHGPDQRVSFFPFAKAGVLALAPDGPRWAAQWLVRAP
jgi:phosphohistidine phosphatase